MTNLPLLPDFNRRQFIVKPTFAGFTPLLFRYGVTTHFLEQGISLRHIQVLLGHNSSKTTELYTQVSVQEIGKIKNYLLENNVICKDKTDEGWGLYGKPNCLNYAPSPISSLFSIFTKEALEADLKELINRQKEDGRWDTWYGISEGTKLEWAGIQTLWALKTLKNYHKIAP
jgi:hypothetical protein